MRAVLYLIVIGSLLSLIWNLLDAAWNRKKIPKLIDIAPIDPARAPAVSVIIPACNEETTVEAALQSVLAQDYPRMEVIAVNDRSTDQTGAVLHRMSPGNANFRVVDIRELPAGWLGKNHAMQTGALAANGEWLLFADADVVMDRSTIARAIAYAVENQRDQLAVAPRAIVGGFLSKVFLGLFGLLFGLHTKPWKVRDPKSKRYIGIGAFNLVRASAWRAVDGFAPIRLRPDDDLKLGKLLKTRGFRCDFASGAELLTVRWYGSFAEMQNGFLKNMFSVFQYNAAVTVLACVGEFAMFVWPFIAVGIFSGVLRELNAVLALLILVFASAAAQAGGVAWWWGLTAPFGALVHIDLMARSTTINLKQGGIVWRGTRYPLGLLRTNRF